MTEGPTIFSTQRCGLCTWHQQEMVKSGLRPEYRHTCGHDAGMAPRELGDDDITPSWCPVQLGKTVKCCRSCAYFKHIGHPQNNGRCTFTMGDYVPEWVVKASTSMRASSGKQCLTWVLKVTA